jgi:hypothetical protein
VRIWEPGPLVGDFGENVWDEKAAAEVMRNYRARRNNFVPIDIEHGTNPRANPKLDPSNPPPTGGYAMLELDASGALWASCAWSDYARQQIEGGERRAISPDWDWDPATKRPVRMNKLSLVHNPGTFGIGLIASAAGAPQENTTMDYTMLKAALQAAIATKDPDAMAAAIQAVLSEIEKSEGGGADELADPMPETAGGAPSEVEELKKTLTAAAQMLDKLPGRRGPRASVAAAGIRETTALDASAVRQLARAEGAAGYREERAKDALIASARTSPGFTEGLETQLRGLPLSTVRNLVANLAPAAGVAGGKTEANATAGADAKTGARGGPLPGAERKPETANLSPAERASIEFIQKAGQSTAHAIAAAEAEAKAKGTPVFSMLHQIVKRPN